MDYDLLYTSDSIYLPQPLSIENFLSFLQNLISELSMDIFIHDLSKIIAFDFVNTSDEIGNYIYESFDQPSIKIFSKELAYACVLISSKLLMDQSSKTSDFCIHCENMYILKLEWDIFITFRFCFNNQIKKAIHNLYQSDLTDTVPIFHDSAYIQNCVFGTLYSRSFLL